MIIPTTTIMKIANTITLTLIIYDIHDSIQYATTITILIVTKTNNNNDNNNNNNIMIIIILITIIITTISIRNIRNNN